MAKTTLFKGVVYLSDEQYAKLIADGVIEVGGQTVTYDESMVYVTPKALGGDYYTKGEVEEKLKTVFDNVTYLDNSYGEQSVLYDTDDGITIMQTTRITQGDKTSDISSELTIPLVGSDEIVFDATEDGSHVQAHLDVNITNKLARTIVTPLSIPSNTELVAVDNTNSQTMLSIGDGLSVENGILKASGGGGQLYLHKIEFGFYIATGSLKDGYTEIITSSQNVFDAPTLASYLYDKGYTSNTNAKMSSIIAKDNRLASGIYATSRDVPTASLYNFEIVDNAVVITSKSGTTTFITDTVTEL